MKEQLCTESLWTSAWSGGFPAGEPASDAGRPGGRNELGHARPGSRDGTGGSYLPAGHALVFDARRIWYNSYELSGVGTPATILTLRMTPLVFCGGGRFTAHGPGVHRPGRPAEAVDHQERNDQGKSNLLLFPDSAPQKS
jgi:hypothetical protein